MTSTALFALFRPFHAVYSHTVLINLALMKKWFVFVLAFICVLAMLYAGIDALSNHQERTGMFLTFVGSMTIIGLLMDFINHLRSRPGM